MFIIKNLSHDHRPENIYAYTVEIKALHVQSWWQVQKSTFKHFIYYGFWVYEDIYLWDP